ncbi:hypothetical protein DYI37_02930 [Fulvimarina endophytica]|uniref:Uncharacterized protein n=1 Tax=Fulvimarina endophytica TaxID=2293836 RepID=A0A371XB46_9HYPH|nr:hypothetical protein [Fulvimarina endophytica]RFC66412.1 hypothetical protein DYI37_02930 [Fulvimarina endophytica]
MMDGQKEDGCAGLRYVRDMLPQLKAITGLPQGTMLPYLLDMARLEAENEIARRKGSLDGRPTS